MSTVSSAMTLHGQGGIGGRFSRRIQGAASKNRLCPLCVSGSNKLFGHKGKHQTTLKRTYIKKKNALNAFPEAVKWKVTKVGILLLQSINTILVNPAHFARKKAVRWRATVEDTLLSDNLSTKKT